MNATTLIHRIQAVALGAGLMLGAVSCSAPSGGPSVSSARCWWRGDGVAGKPRMVIDLSQQRVRYFKGDQLVGLSPISSGRESHATVNGKFSIIEKDIDHRSSVYGAYVDGFGSIVQGDVDARVDPKPPGTEFVGASMRYFMRITGGVGMHEGYLPGYPASHGCIRVPTKMAEIFFRETPHGTPVEIIGHGALAAAEDEIPLGHDSVEVAYEPQPAASAAAPPPVVSDRQPARELAEARGSARPASPAPRSVRYNPAHRVKYRKPPRGATLFLEE